MRDESCRSWAVEEFGGAKLGDERRTARLIAMGAEAAHNPGGHVSTVFRRSSDRQGAYDFLESKHVRSRAILDAVVAASCRRAAASPFVFVPLDGTSLNLTDLARTKDFGSVGSRERGGRGLKLIDAVAVAPDGTTLGVAAMQWWARDQQPSTHRRTRSVDQKELHHWLDAVDAVTTSLAAHAPSTHAWFQLDREGDAQHLLEKLDSCGHLFTVRSRTDRRLSISGLTLPGAGRHPTTRRRYLHAYMRRQPSVSQDLLELPARGDQAARLACVSIRTAKVILLMCDQRTSRRQTLAVNVVWVTEYGRGRQITSRSGKTTSRAVDWMLLTNHSVATADEAREVVRGYTHRWRIEDFHRAWKSGICKVEDSQLRTREHVIKWATVLASVAARAERLKHLSRAQPHGAATLELSQREIRALILLKRRYRKQTEHIGDDTPDLETATRWIAELGGYTGKASGPPGSVTIARGLAQLHIATEMLAAIRAPRSD
jgi:transposase-like protein/DDE family transposase